jgi:hypothetical protein
VVALAAAFALWGVVAVGAQPMSMTEFRDAYVAAVQKAHPEDKVAIKSDNVVDVTNAKGETTTTYLDHGYAAYRQDPGALAEIMDHELAALDVAANMDAFTADQLLVLVRPASYLAADTPRSKKPLSRPIAGDLVALVGVDQPKTWEYPPASRLRRVLKMTNDEIWDRALANTAKRLPALPKPSAKKVVSALVSDAGLSSSLLAEPDIWDTPEQQQGGAPVVAPVAKDMVLMVHEGDAKGVAALRGIAAKAASDSEGLSDQLFVRRNGAWEVLPP